MSIGQGFGCEFASLGAVQGMVGAFGGIEAIFRAHLTAVSGASSGAKIAALIAQPSLSLSDAAQILLKIRATDLFLSDSAFSALRRGGLCGGEPIIKLMESFWGKGLLIEALPTAFGTTAFNLDSRESVKLLSGDLARACQASGSFPGVFAPIYHQGSRLWDLAGYYDPAGVEGLPEVAFRGTHRLLQVVNGDWNLKRFIVKKPSDIASVNCTEVVSVVMQNHTKVVPLLWPGWSTRAHRAFHEAKFSVDAALDKPLTPGSEPGHFLCLVEPPNQDTTPKAAIAATGIAIAIAYLLLGGGAAGL